MTPSISGTSRIAASAPLFPIATAFAVGILADGLFSIRVSLSVGIFVLTTASAIVVVKPQLRHVLILIAVAFAGAGMHGVRGEVVGFDRIKRMCDDGRLPADEPVGVEGTVRDVPEDSPGGLFFELETIAISRRNVTSPASGRIRVFLAETEDLSERDIGAGEKVRVFCAPDRADQFINPGVATRAEILERLELDATCSLKSALLIERLAPPQGFSLVGAVRTIRAKLIARFLDAFDGPTAGVMIASLLGSKRYLDKSTATAFRDGGTFHVLVISGLHITFIGGLVFAVVGLATRRRGVRFLITTTILWSFSVAVGAEVPVVRAALMFTVVLFADVVFRDSNQLNSLGLSALVLLVWRPEDLFAQSFQLTFASVAAIVAGAFPFLKSLRAVGEWHPSASTPLPPNVSQTLRRCCETLYWRESRWTSDASRNIWSAKIVKHPWFVSGAAQIMLRFVVEGTVVSLIVQITLLPLSVLFFNRISTASILLNLWVGVLIAVETFAACAALILREVNQTLAMPLIRLTELLNKLLLLPPRLLIEFDAAGFRLPAYSGRAAAIYVLYFVPVVILFALAIRWQPFELRRRRTVTRLTCAFAALTLMILIVAGHPFSKPAPDGRLRIDFLDVGQGDSALITFPDGRTMLVDGGGRPQFGSRRSESDTREPFVPDGATIGERVVSKFLWYRGLSEVDYILATHADADHIQGLADVAANFRVGTALFGRLPSGDPDYIEVEKVLERRRIPSATLARGDKFNIAGVEVDVLWPPSSSGGASENNDSVVLRLKFGARTILLTGDIERAAERGLLAESSLVRCDVVKVAHHGSRTSSTQDFIAASGAAFAVISVGRRSRFGHPHAEVVQRWRDSGAKLLTTGDRGTVTVSTDGRELSVTTFLGTIKD